LTITWLVETYVYSNALRYTTLRTQVSYRSTPPHSAPTASLEPSGFHPKLVTESMLSTTFVPDSSHAPRRAEYVNSMNLSFVPTAHVSPLGLKHADVNGPTLFSLE